MGAPAEWTRASSRDADDVAGVDVVVSVLVGLNFAVASPVLDYLGRNPDVFTVRDAPPSDVIGVLLLLTLGLPLAVGVLAYAGYRLRRRFGRVLHGLLLGGLLTCFLAQLLDRLTPLTRWPAPGLFAVAAALALPPTYAYFRNRELRGFVRFGVVAPVAFAGLFAFATPAGSLLARAEPLEEAEAGFVSPTPVVLVMFDALPVVSLMDGEERIDGDLFPAFARFAQDATWFRNTATHSAATRRVLPTLLTGDYAEGDYSLSVRDFPQNLFTVLADSHRTVAYEPMSALCPTARCARVERRPTTQERWSELSRDVGVLSLHAVLPRSLHDRLPPAEQAIGDFAGGGTVDWTDDGLAETEAWEHFLDELRPDARPGLHVFHSLKPHWPWHSLPSGQDALPPRSEPHKGYISQVWKDDWMRVAQWQRHLLQVGYVDRRLGELLDELDRVGIYDDALVIVASDHGEAFTVGSPLRIPADGNLGEIAFATLMMKLPGQQAPQVVDDPAGLVDVVPTILDVLDVPDPPATDGSSLLRRRPDDRQRTIEGWDYEGSVSADARERREALAAKVEVFGPAGGWERILGVGPHADLIDRDVPEVGVTGEAAGHVRVDLPFRLHDVDPAAPRLPTLITGSVYGGEDLDASTHLAIALNGRVAAVVRPYAVTGSSARLLAVVPQSALVAGDNPLEIFEVHEAGGQRTLRPFAIR